jgi:hypothetical protein
MEKCDVTWCEAPATLQWVRTAKELKAMRGPRIKGSRSEALPVRIVCADHCPSWRADVYKPLAVRVAA